MQEAVKVVLLCDTRREGRLPRILPRSPAFLGSERGNLAASLGREFLCARLAAHAREFGNRQRLLHAPTISRQGCTAHRAPSPSKCISFSGMRRSLAAVSGAPGIGKRL